LIDTIDKKFAHPHPKSDTTNRVYCINQAVSIKKVSSLIRSSAIKIQRWEATLWPSRLNSYCWVGSGYRLF